MTPFNCAIWIIFSYAISIIITWSQVTWETGDQDNSIDTIHIPRIQNRQIKWSSININIACYNNDQIALQTIKESQTSIYCTIWNFTRCLPSVQSALVLYNHFLNGSITQPTLWLSSWRNVSVLFCVQLVFLKHECYIEFSVLIVLHCVFCSISWPLQCVRVY